MKYSDQNVAISRTTDPYYVGQWDTFESIAFTLYHDRSFAPLIATMNDCDVDLVLSPGLALMLPSSVLQTQEQRQGRQVGSHFFREAIFVGNETNNDTNDENVNDVNDDVSDESDTNVEIQATTRTLER